METASLGCKWMVSCSTVQLIQLTSQSMMKWSQPFQGAKSWMTHTFKCPWLAMHNEYNVIMYNFPWIYFLQNHISHSLPGPGWKTHEWNLGDPDWVIVFTLIAPKNSFRIRIMLNHNVAQATSFLRWDLPLPFWVLLYIFGVSPTVFMWAHKKVPQGPDLATTCIDGWFDKLNGVSQFLILAPCVKGL